MDMATNNAAPIDRDERSPGIRIAILVLAATAPDVFRLLVSLWPQTQFFVHVDAKADISKFGFIMQAENTEIISARFPIYWGGWNMVRAELELMRTAIARGYDRLLLISDDSFPLRSLEEITRRVSADALHLGLWEMPESHEGYVRYKEYFYFDSMATNIRSHGIYTRSISDRDLLEIAALSSLKVRGKKSLPMVYRGPQWWCLTARAAAYVLHVHDSDEHMRESFRFSLIPDEHYIHTILGLSPHAYSLQCHPIWTDISRVPSPYVFTEIGELEAALASTYLFVRKVAISAAQQLSDYRRAT
jgi:Core-2/I-Branching enzyme